MKTQRFSEGWGGWLVEGVSVTVGHDHPGEGFIGVKSVALCRNAEETASPRWMLGWEDKLIFSWCF